MGTEPHVRRRIVVCVDGTWYNEDGKEGKGTGNNSNIFRIWASVKEGRVVDQNGNEFEQIRRYFSGIGVGKDFFPKHQDGIFGAGCAEQIREVYQFCCDKVRNSEDEVWLFGFSRGAYVVRAVSVLLDNGISKKPTFGLTSSETWNNMMRWMPKTHSRPGKPSTGGQKFRFMAEKSLPGPTIRFLGLFDAVQMHTDKFDIDISHIHSIKAIRHAVALNELVFPPILYDFSRMSDKDGSIIQAWFAGVHRDLGGGAQEDGLSLYPLQWMLIESKAQGLELEHKPETRLQGLIENPLRLAGLMETSTGSVPDASPDLHPWKYRYSNGLEISMYDLREIHQNENIEKLSRVELEEIVNQDKDDLMYGPRRATHEVRLSVKMWQKMGRGNRRVFDESKTGRLIGYDEHNLRGSIIHPSVYYLLDDYGTRGIAKALKSLKPDLDKFRKKGSLHYIGNGRDTEGLSSFTPWFQETPKQPATQPTCRILICGNTGVGKSTLLNLVFGIPMSNESQYRSGKHDIERAFEYENRPGILIHDSEGFQAGTSKEMDLFKKFLRKRSSLAEPREQLHAVWICIESFTPRPVQESIANVLEILSKITPNIPVIVVGTKADHLLVVQALNNDYNSPPSATQQPSSDMEVIARIESMFQKEFETDERTKFAWSQLDRHLVFVARNNKDSIVKLVQMTLDSVKEPASYEAMCASQIQDVNAKIDQAVEKVLGRLRQAVVNASLGGFTAIGSLLGTPTISRLLCTDIIVGCYGMPPEYAAKIEGMMSKVVWANLAPFVTQSLTNLLTVVPLFVAAPIFEAPAAARMVIKCGCDLILIMDQAFRDSDEERAVNWDKLNAVIDRYKKRNTSIVRSDGRETRVSKQRLVHAKVNELVPFVSSLGFRVHGTNSISELRDNCRNIIEEFRIHSDDSYGEDAKSIDDLTSLSTDMSDDTEDIDQLFGGKGTDWKRTHEQP